MKSLITAVFLAGIAGQALAGEDSTHRLHGVGPAWYEIEDGLRKLAAAGSDEPDSRHVALERVSASDAYLPEADRGLHLGRQACVVDDCARAAVLALSAVAVRAAGDEGERRE
jgi:hypothetical protein